ncbi:hypothetical protein F4780DRAFT_781607 [Xylariomycetidae sp. FL0641]|nr:hypothetical protein F4780DRAFT_781607 [Xylariomycetidae sp. FL0641]
MKLQPLLLFLGAAPLALGSSLLPKHISQETQEQSDQTTASFMETGTCRSYVCAAVLDACALALESAVVVAGAKTSRQNALGALDFRRWIARGCGGAPGVDEVNRIFGFLSGLPLEQSAGCKKKGGCS